MVISWDRSKLEYITFYLCVNGAVLRRCEKVIVSVAELTSRKRAQFPSRMERKLLFMIANESNVHVLSQALGYFTEIILER